jgi:hypothetical protein
MLLLTTFLHRELVVYATIAHALRCITLLFSFTKKALQYMLPATYEKLLVTHIQIYRDSSLSFYVLARQFLFIYFQKV